MSEAVRKVTIIVDVKPGDIQMPDVGWITEAQTELKDLVDKQTDVADIVKKTRQETEELVKVQTESAKVQTELDEQKAESANAAKDAGAKEVEEHKKTLQAKKTNTEEWEENLKKRQAEWAENQRKIDEEAAKRKTDLLEKEKQAVESHEKTVKQIQQQYQGDPSVRPLTEPGQNPTAVKPLNGDPAVRPLFDPENPDTRWRSQQGGIIPPSSGPPNDPPDETFEEKARRLREASEAARRRLEEIEANKGAQNERWEQESKESANVTKANDDMPKHWRNVGLNAGQAAASVARYVGHMRLLKHVGGDSLESMAKEFMTIQSRVALISASTAAFTNFGTMVDGIKEAAKDTQTLVTHQERHGQAATAAQQGILGMGKAAAAITPLIAPAQAIFTAITAAVVAADIAMDFFTESEEEAAEKAAKLIKTYDEGLDKVIKKLEIERDLLNSQNGLIEAQWEIKKLMAGEAGLTAEQQKTMMDEKRKQADDQTEQALGDSVATIIQAGLPEEVKKAQEENKQEAERIAKEQREKRAEIAKMDDLYAKTKNPLAAHRIDELEGEMGALNKEAQTIDERKNLIDIATDADLQKKLKNVNVKDGAIENFDDILNDFKWSDNPTAKKAMVELSKQMSDAASLVSGQASSATQASEEAKMLKKTKEQETIDLSDRFKDEEAVAKRFGSQEATFAMTSVDAYLKQMEDPATTFDQKKDYVKEIGSVLSQADLMTPDVAKVLERGGAAEAGDIKEGLADAKEFTPAERAEIEDLIKKADAAIQKAETDAMDMKVVADALMRTLETNSKQLADLRKAIDARDGI
jgi:hypothetical protein